MKNYTLNYMQIDMHINIIRIDWSGGYQQRENKKTNKSREIKKNKNK